jgi:hypothetical protein
MESLLLLRNNGRAPEAGLPVLQSPGDLAGRNGRRDWSPGRQAGAAGGADQFNRGRQVMIKVRFATLDGIRKTKSFKTLAGARKATWAWAGKDCEIGSSYAISTDGVVRVMVEGCTLKELFAAEEKKAAGPAPEWFVVDAGGITISNSYGSEAAAKDAMTALHADGYTGALHIEGWYYDAASEDYVPLSPANIVVPARPGEDSEEIPF